ncbi:MAG: winged helix-turn-helix domain-containing protein [Alphaproteobacteria bacterium]|nr:winged helix-turn-helix domain-containing protein [Alphaproteobacteria bacterium]
MLLLDGFRLDRRAGGLFRVDERGSASLVPLGSRTLDLLSLLARRNGETVTKEELMTIVWSGRAVEEANLNVQISKLRHILDQDRVHGSCIQTVTGYGYRFTARVLVGDRGAGSPALIAAPPAPPNVIIGRPTGSASGSCESGDDTSRVAVNRPPFAVERVNPQCEASASRDPGTVTPASLLLRRLGTIGVIDDGQAASLSDMRRRLIDDYGDDCAAILLSEQVIAAYQEFIQVTGWVARLSATVEHALFANAASELPLPDQDDALATSAVGQHLAQLSDGLVPLVEQCAGAMRNALIALEALRTAPAREEPGDVDRPTGRVRSTDGSSR